MPGCRSSDFFCRVHLLVAVSTASTMSLAMLRGRDGFLVIGLLRIVGQDDRTLAAVGILDIRRRQVQGTDHRRVGIGPHLRQRVLQPYPGRSEGAERVVDPDAPVGTGDELAGDAGALFQAGLM